MIKKINYGKMALVSVSNYIQESEEKFNVFSKNA